MFPIRYFLFNKDLTIILTHNQETIGLTFSMDYLGFFGYEQSTNLFLKEPEILTMAKLFLTRMLNLNLAFSNIVYDKDDIIINELELNSYLELYKNNYI